MACVNIFLPISNIEPHHRSKHRVFFKLENTVSVYHLNRRQLEPEPIKQHIIRVFNKCLWNIMKPKNNWNNFHMPTIYTHLLNGIIFKNKQKKKINAKIVSHFLCLFQILLVVLPTHANGYVSLNFIICIIQFP